MSRKSATGPAASVRELSERWRALSQGERRHKRQQWRVSGSHAFEGGSRRRIGLQIDVGQATLPAKFASM